MSKIIFIGSNQNTIQSASQLANQEKCQFEYYTEQEWYNKLNSSSDNVVPFRSSLLMSESNNLLYAKNQTLTEIEAASIQQALVKTKGNVSKAARILSIGRATLYRKIKEYDISILDIRDDQQKKTYSAA